MASEKQEDSFTKMDSPLDTIGAHCAYEYCHQLDFLPFRCESCKSTYCLDHRTETAHKCPKAGEWARNRNKAAIGTGNTGSGRTLNGMVPTNCSAAKCSTIINTMKNTGSRCDKCNRQYCLKHRLQEEHDCKNIVPLGARQSDNATANPFDNSAEKLRSGFSRLRAWTKDKQTTIKPKSKASVAAATSLATINTLKRNAKGDSNVPGAKRLYVNVEAEAHSQDSQHRAQALFFSVDWSVGRMLDDAAKRMQISNLNNRAEGESDRLRVYHVEGGKLLEFNEKLGAVPGLKTGDTIALLRGVEGLEEQ